MHGIKLAQTVPNPVKLAEVQKKRIALVAKETGQDFIMSTNAFMSALLASTWTNIITFAQKLVQNHLLAIQTPKGVNMLLLAHLSHNI